jgi:Cdc6-like AAA superfamily ATPase
MPVSADIRRFLTEAFSDEEITTLCFDQFRPVYDTFAGGMTKGQKIQLLIEHCERRDEWSTLLSALQRERPRQFAKFLDANTLADSPAQAAITNISGGINMNANEVSIGGDAVGRDKVVNINGNFYIIHVGNDTDPLPVVHAIDEPPTTPARLHVDNPFYTRGRINDPALFFDREQLVREIQVELKKRCSISLIGESRIGKSSLLYYLFKTSGEWLPNVAVVYVDLRRILDEADFCSNVLEKLGESGSTLRELRHALDMRDVVLLLDEVEKLFDKDFSPKLHNLLRALAQEPNFAMFVATQLPLEEIFPPSNLTSPFHNIFIRKMIGSFSEAEARRFLIARLQGTGVTFTEREVTRLIADSHCHPAALQGAAKELFDQKMNNA